MACTGQIGTQLRLPWQRPPSSTCEVLTAPTGEVLERLGVTDLAAVRRTGAHGAELHLSGKAAAAGGEMRVAYVTDGGGVLAERLDRPDFERGARQPPEHPRRRLHNLADIAAGVGEVDASWHVGSGAGQHASAGSFVDQHGFDPSVHSYHFARSYGLQSRLKVRAIVVEGPGVRGGFGRLLRAGREGRTVRWS